MARTKAPVIQGNTQRQTNAIVSNQRAQRAHDTAINEAKNAPKRADYARPAGISPNPPSQSQTILDDQSTQMSSMEISFAEMETAIEATQENFNELLTLLRPFLTHDYYYGMTAPQDDSAGEKSEDTSHMSPTQLRVTQQVAQLRGINRKMLGLLHNVVV